LKFPDEGFGDYLERLSDWVLWPGQLHQRGADMGLGWLGPGKGGGGELWGKNFGKTKTN